MASYTKDQLQEIVNRVASEVSKEASLGEGGRAYQVSDLREHFQDLVKGGAQAWTISYSTSRVALEPALGRLGDAAWTISYSTSSVALTPGAEKLSR